MDKITTTQAPSPLLGAGWSDPLEEGVRGRVRAFIEAILEEELAVALGRGRYERAEEAGAEALHLKDEDRVAIPCRTCGREFG